MFNDGALQLEVSDDGRGLSPSRGRGVGLDSMRERAEELGGSLVVEPLPTGGTRVRAMLPLAGGTTPPEAPSGASGTNPRDTRLVASP